MLRGCEKKVIYIPGAEHNDFEAAYFILRRGADGHPGSKDILREANRIAEQTLPAARRRARRRAGLRRVLFALLWFLVGAVAGALPFVLRLLVLR